MRTARWFEQIQKALFAFFLLSLPVSSFPYLPSFLGGNAQVRPLSFYPLIFLFVLVIIPRFLRGKLPKVFLPLFVFSLIALISTCLGFITNLENASELTLINRGMRTIFTLLLGLSIYLTVSLFPRTKNELASALRWIYGGFAVALAWGSLQIVYVLHFNWRYFSVLNKLQRMISSRKLFHNRISGLTFEPNWFAEQITFLLMPWLFASVITSHSIFKWRWHKVTIEMILLVWSSFVLVFTYSRAGLFLFFVEMGIAIVAYWKQGRQKLKKEGKHSWWKRILIGLLVVVLVLAVIVAFGMKNSYFARLWEYWAIKDQIDQSYFEYIAFSQRFVYWQAAYRMFEGYPLLGVGLGYYTFQFPEYFADRPLNEIPELLRKFTPDVGRNTVVTVKNFFMRLLAETGLVGSALFFAFLLVLFGLIIYLLRSQDVFWKYWGTAGGIGLIVFLLVTMSFDSFAIPNMWVVFGLITAGAFVHQQDTTID